MASEYSSDFEPIDGFIGDESVEMETAGNSVVELDDGDDQNIELQSTADSTVDMWDFHLEIDIWFHNLYIL